MGSQIRLFDLLKKEGPLHDLYEPYWEPDYFDEANMLKRKIHIDTVPIMQKIRQYMENGTTFIGHNSRQSKAIFCTLIDVCDDLNLSYAKHIHQTGIKLSKDIKKVVNIMKSKLKIIPEQPIPDAVNIDESVIYRNLISEMDRIAEINEQNIDRITIQEPIDNIAFDRHETTRDIEVSINDSFITGNFMYSPGTSGQQRVPTAEPVELRVQDVEPIIPRGEETEPVPAEQHVPTAEPDELRVQDVEPIIPRGEEMEPALAEPVELRVQDVEPIIPRGEEMEPVPAEQRVPTAEPVEPRVQDVEPIIPQEQEIQPVLDEQHIPADEPVILHVPEMEPAVPIVPYVIPNMQPPNIGFFPNEEVAPIDLYLQIIPPDEDEPSRRPLFIREAKAIPPRERGRRIPVQQPIQNAEFVGAEFVRVRLPSPTVQEVPVVAPGQPDRPSEPAQPTPTTSRGSVVAPGELGRPIIPEPPTAREEARASYAELSPPLVPIPAGAASPPIDMPATSPSDSQLLLKLMKIWAENAVSGRVLSISIDDVCAQNTDPASKWDIHASLFRLCDFGLVCINPENNRRLRLTQGPRITHIFKNLRERSQ